MADTELADVTSAIQTFWPSVFTKELREMFVLAGLIDKTPGGMSTIRQGDTIRLNQVNKFTGQLQPTTDCTFTPETLSLSTVDVVCDQRAVASVTLCDLVELKSLVNINNTDLRESMAWGMNDQINTHLYSFIAPTTDNTAVATFDAGELTTLTQQADEAFWPRERRWLIVDPLYHKQLLDDTTLVDVDSSGNTDRPVIGGMISQRRFGWNIVVDNSGALAAAVNASAAGVALAFIPEFLHMVMGRDVQVKVSDRHSNNEFRIGMSVDTVFGAALGISGADKHILTRTGV